MSIGALLVMQTPAAFASPPIMSTVGQNITVPGTVTASNVHNQNTGDSYLIFQPGGTAGGNIYTDFNDLYTQLQLVHGQKYIQFDNTFVSPVVIPAGTYDLDHAIFSTLGYATGGFANVNLADGVVLERWGGLSNNVHVHSLSSAPIYTIVNGQTEGFGMLNGATVVAEGSAPVFQVDSGGGLYNLFENGSGLQTGTTAATNVDTGGVYLTTLGNLGQVNDNTVTGAGTFYALIGSPSAQASDNQTGFTGSRITQIAGQASMLSYANAVSHLIATTVQAAIDELAAGLAKLSDVQTGTFNFGVVGPGDCSLQSTTVTGAAEGDTLALGLPSSFSNFDFQAMTATAFVSAPDTVSVRLCNAANGPLAFTSPIDIKIRLMK